ncbi:transmembrane amino acid transporter protein [Helicosporidium sp. ATCC 50920]|nr:transmembrane amino acid transporter protein [Helicosporidium sp. ATCC 50920]|eukprot:KDD77191.1 transmembrane amino acid transporter protein [Helicosporidium sp. ATCC 50920]
MGEDKDLRTRFLTDETEDGSMGRLGSCEVDGEEEDLEQPAPAVATCGSCGNTGAICNLAVTAVGAGMLALPKAMEQVGILLGFVLFGVVCLLTYYSSSIIIKFADRRKKATYAELVKDEFGSRGTLTLQLSIITHVAGVMIVYLIIIADMLVGSAPKWEGVLTTLLHRHDAPWFLTRSYVTGVLVIVAIVPMLISRDLTVVARYSRNSIIMMLFLAGTMMALAGLALWQGQQADIHFLPIMEGSLVRASLKLGGSILSVLSVSFLAFTCQFNLLPVHRSLRNSALFNMLQVTRSSIALCLLLYGMVAVSGYVMFGSSTEGDVLKNLTINYVSTLTSPSVATGFIDFIVVATTFNLLVNFVLKVWAVREAVSELCFESCSLNLSKRSYYMLTYALTAAAYLVSVFIPSVWTLLSLVGSTACVTFSYIFPGLIMARNGPTRSSAASGYAVVALAVIMAAVAISSTLSGHTEL